MAKMKKARDIKDAWMRSARKFCKDNDLTGELDIIEDMDWPPTWNLSSEDKSKPESRTKRWFRLAVRGNFEKMFIWKRIDTRPEKWDKHWSTWETALCDYLNTPEGSGWQKRNNDPAWVRGLVSPAPLTPSTTPDIPLPVLITLSAGQDAELKNLGLEFGEKPEILAKIWIVERLRQLRQNLAINAEREGTVRSR